MKFTWCNGRSLESAEYGEVKTSYKYNQEKIRKEKTVNGVTTKYILDGSKIVAEDTDGKVIWYIYDSDDELKEYRQKMEHIILRRIFKEILLQFIVKQEKNLQDIHMTHGEILQG